MPLKIIQYKVRGRGSFPVDMLRYDSSWPATETDSYRILEDGPRDVQLQAVTTKRDRDSHPTAGRWESFGWRVLPGS